MHFSDKYVRLFITESWKLKCCVELFLRNRFNELNQNTFHNAGKIKFSSLVSSNNPKDHELLIILPKNALRLEVGYGTISDYACSPKYISL